MAVSERVKEIVDYIYRAYGTDSGTLFGIPPHCRTAVESVVKVALDMVAQDEEDE